MSPAQWYARQRARLALAEAERHRAAGETDAAVAAWERAAGLDAAVRLQALDAAASLLIGQNRPADAVPRLQRLVELGKKDVASWRRLARALRETGDRKASIKAWRRVEEADPRDLEACRALAEMMPEGAPETIPPLRILAEAAGTSDPGPWRRLARLLEQGGDAEGAIDAWRAVLAAAPGDMAARERLSVLLDERGRKPEAAEHMRRLAEADSSKAKPWKRYARTLEELGEPEAAFRIWRRVLDIDSTDAQAHGRLADLLLAQGLKARALVHIRAVAEAGTEKGPWRRLARALTELSRTGEAVSAWRGVLEIAPGEFEAHTALAGLLADSPAEALPHLRAVAEGTPKKPEAWRALGRALAGLGEAEAAIEAWRRLLKLDESDIEAHAALAELVGDRKAAALPHLQVLAERGPDLAAARRKLGLVLEKTGDAAGAREAFERLIEVAPEDPLPHERLSQILAEAGDRAGAARSLRWLAEHAPDQDKPWRRLAQGLKDVGDPAGEMRAWEHVLALLPADPQAHERLAAMLEEAGRKAEAAEHLRAVAEADPSKTKAWKRYARALEELGQGAEAFQAWRQVLELDADDPHAHDRLAELLLAQGLKARALEHVRALVGEGADRAALKRLARLLTELSQTDEAVAAWRRVLEVAPAELEAHAALAELLKDDPALAGGHLRALAEATPKKPEPWRALARTLTAVGDRAGADEAWRRVLKLQGDDPEAQEAIIELGDRKAAKRWAKSLEDAGDAAGAFRIWNRVLELDAEDPHAHEELARLLLSLGRPGEAAAHLRALAEQDPQNLRRWRRLAACFRQAGDPDGEADAWRGLAAVQPSEVEAHEHLAQLLEARGDLTGAAQHVRVLAELEDWHPRSWRRLARLFEKGGDEDGAIVAWTLVCSMEPADLAARERLSQLLLDRGRPGEAAVHLQVLAAADADKAKAWRRLALALQAAERAPAEIDAWEQVLALEATDLQAHERLAQLLAEAGREAEALPHLQAVVRLAPENARAWRRYARLLRKVEPEIAPLDVWRQTLSAAGQSELEALLRGAEEASRRSQALKLELQTAGVELQRERAAAKAAVDAQRARVEEAVRSGHELKRELKQQHKQDMQALAAELKQERTAAQQAVSRLEREERAHRSTYGLLKDEVAERRRLTAELQESVQRQRQAEAEEQSHLLAGRLLGLLEPLTAGEPLPVGHSDAAAAYAEAAVRSAAASGAVIAARDADARLAGVEVTSPDALAARLRGRSGKVVILADSDPAAREAARSQISGKRGVTALDLAQLTIRMAAGVEDLKSPVEPVSDDVWPSRPVMVIGADGALRQAVVDSVRTATDLAFAPLFPAELAARLEARELDLDDWLAAAWSAHGRPRVFGFQFDPDSLALFAREIRAGRAQIMAKVFRRATALELVWSDKALAAAADHYARSGEVSADFDAGDAQIEVKTYKQVVARDMQVQSAIAQLGKFRPATVRVYRELFDKPALGRFCRDAGLALAVSGFAEVDERALGFSPSRQLVRAGELIKEAVVSLTATREPEAPPAGLVHYGLGRSLEALGRHAEALEAYQEAVLRAPTYFPARAAAARYLELAGRAGEAEQLLREALGAGTPDPDVQEGLLDFYQRNASPFGVAATSRLMRRRGQSRPAIAAPALIELGRYREAEPLLNAIAPRIAEQDTFLNDLVDLPDLAARLGELQQAAEADGADPTAMLAYAEALRRLGRLAESLPWRRKALADPGVLERALGLTEVVRPQFLMVGPPRTGTTLLRRLFELHPQIATPSGELFFFSSRTGERAGSNRQRAPLSWYLDAFRAAADKKPGARVVGEKTPHYFSTSDEQMAFASQLLPDVRIIATLRDPVVRAWSEIKVQRRVTEAEIVAALGEGRRPNWLAEILDAGRYVAHLKRWLKHVGADRVLLVDSDALETNVVEEAGRIFRWLGVRELSRRQVEALQRGWDNRTEAFAPSAAVEELLRRSYDGEPWTSRDVGRAIGLRETTSAPPDKPRRAPGARTPAK